MSKILLVKAKRSRNPGGGTHYTYPPEYSAQQIQVLCYESVGENEIVSGRDNSTNPHEYLIGVVSDADAPHFLKSSDIREINQADANEKGRRWRPQIEQINDQTKVISILAKAVRGTQMLTSEEEQAINPDNPAIGISKSKLFDDLLAEYLE